MNGKILVTDTLFIFDKHVKQLEEAGFEVVRIEKSDSTEDEMVEAVKGKVGYLIGGIEKVTDKVIDAADELKAIVFVGADWAGYIPGHEAATKKGIAIANAPGANKYAVAEYTITLLLIMLRRVPELSRIGNKSFLTTDSLPDITVGIVGLGKIGEQVVRMLRGLGARKIIYWNRTRKPELEKELKLEYKELEEVVSESDVLTNHLASLAGVVFDQNLISKLKANAIIINTGSEANFDFDALYEVLKADKARAAFDHKPHDPNFDELPIEVWFCSQGDGTAYNTHLANRIASDMATASVINLLTTGKDQHKVN